MLCGVIHSCSLFGDLSLYNPEKNESNPFTIYLAFNSFQGTCRSTILYNTVLWFRICEREVTNLACWQRFPWSNPQKSGIARWCIFITHMLNMQSSYVGLCWWLRFMAETTCPRIVILHRHITYSVSTAASCVCTYVWVITPSVMWACNRNTIAESWR